MTHEITKVEIYWDRDGHEEGWAYRTFRGNLEESGSLDGDYMEMPDAPSETEMQDAVAYIASFEGREIDPFAVAVEQRDGGYAHWEANA